MKSIVVLFPTLLGELEVLGEAVLQFTERSLKRDSSAPAVLETQLATEVPVHRGAKTSAKVPLPSQLICSRS